MDIEGLGDKIVDQLVSGGFVKSYGDSYRLTLPQVANLERMGERSAEKLLAGIQTSKRRGLARLLNALSIRHVGETVAEVLARSFGNMDGLMSASLEQLRETEEIGPIIAQSVYDYLHSDFGQRVIEDLRSEGLQLEADARPTSDNAAFAGKTFVVTGTLARRSRDEMHEFIKQHGGKTSGSVSKKTSYLWP
jgi:DNA ligase (NAD+)